MPVINVSNLYSNSLNKDSNTQAYYGVDFSAGLVAGELIDASNSSIKVLDLDKNDVTDLLVDTASLTTDATGKQLLFILKKNDLSMGTIFELNITAYVNANKSLGKKLWLFVY